MLKVEPKYRSASSTRAVKYSYLDVVLYAKRDFLHGRRIKFVSKRCWKNYLNQPKQFANFISIFYEESFLLHYAHV